MAGASSRKLGSWGLWSCGPLWVQCAHERAGSPSLPNLAASTWRELPKRALHSRTSSSRRHRLPVLRHAPHSAGLHKALVGPFPGSTVATHSRPCSPASSACAHSATGASAFPRSGYEGSVFRQGHVRRLCCCEEEGSYLHYLLEESQAQTGAFTVVRSEALLIFQQRQG